MANMTNKVKANVFTVSNQKVQQLKLIIKFLLPSLSFLLINNFISHHYQFTNAQPALLLGILFFALLHSYVSLDTTNIVSGMLLWGLAILATYLAWHGEGLFDTAMLAFPCIIMLAIILANRIVYFPLCLFMISTLAFFAYSYNVKLLENTFNQSGVYYWHRMTEQLVLVLFFTVGMALFAQGARTRLRKLIIKNRQLKNEIKHTEKFANYDQLTKLPNERICHQDIINLIEKISPNGEMLSLLTLDLRNLRIVNSSLGHNVGDEIIKQLTLRLTIACNESAYLYRFQGNEFCLLKHVVTYEDVAHFAEQILQTTTNPFSVLEYEVEIVATIGIAMAPFDGDTLSELRRKSHMALYNIRKNINQQYIFYDDDMTNLVEYKYALIRALKQAIQAQEFELYYQPKVNLTTQLIIGCEALVRWNRPSHGIVPPDVFIGLAEESGLITEITKWVLRIAVTDCKAWHRQGLTGLSVAVNLSSLDFRRGNLPQIIYKALSEVNLAPHYLELELTESMLIDDVDLIQGQIQELHSKGVHFTIDDFGTGYSNLGYLSKFNVSTLKIDQSFIKNINESEHDFHIVRAILQMCQSLGIENVSEGIEDAATEATLRELNCQYGQGYYWSKPLPNKAFTQLVVNNLNNHTVNLSASNN
jgi:diguanylate cyclase